MNNEDRALFKKALIEAVSERYEAELLLCSEPIRCSDAHASAMKSILRHGARPAKRQITVKKKVIIGLLIAALLLLAGCAAYIYREEINGFIVEMYAKHIMITPETEAESETGSEAMITESYTLTYVPDGYSLAKEYTWPAYKKYEWQHENGEYLIFEQSFMKWSSFAVDAENGTTDVIQCDQYDVYCRLSTVNSYVWNNGKYSFHLTSSTPLSEDTLLRIIQEMRITES